MAKVEKPLAPKPGLTFTLTEAAFHHYNLRPLIGIPGLIAGVLESGLLIVQYAEGTRHCAPGYGVVGPAPAPPKPDELAPRRVSVQLWLPPRELSPNNKAASMGGRMAKAKETRLYRANCANKYRETLRPQLVSGPLRTPVVMDLVFWLSRVRPDYDDVLLRRDLQPEDGKHFIDLLYFPTDEDNARAAIKAGIDGLADAGILPGDDARYLKTGQTVLHRGKAANGKTMLVMTLTEPGYVEKEETDGI